MFKLRIIANILRKVAHQIPYDLHFLLFEYQPPDYPLPAQLPGITVKPLQYACWDIISKYKPIIMEWQVWGGVIIGYHFPRDLDITSSQKLDIQPIYKDLLSTFTTAHELSPADKDAQSIYGIYRNAENNQEYLELKPDHTFYLREDFEEHTGTYEIIGAQIKLNFEDAILLHFSGW